jgi:hypothetical protein
MDAETRVLLLRDYESSNNSLEGIAKRGNGMVCGGSYLSYKVMLKRGEPLSADNPTGEFVHLSRIRTVFLLFETELDPDYDTSRLNLPDYVENLLK